ncbi:MAG TPA: hypothetical protein VFV99_29805 [Kofleriaceae bacterium]|nr:hypothetical protein [Kofleriaceae bacterium]
MSESFVDLSYRGLALGKRIKLTQVRATAGYLEMPTPMPVGTTIGMSTDDGVLFEATVAEVREQVTGSDKPPGMVVKPKLDADAQRSWWKQRVTVDEKPLPKPDAEGKVTVRSRRSTGDATPSELMDDGRNTAVMDAVDDSAGASGELAAQKEVTDPSLPRISAEIAAQNPIVDDGKRTMMMDAVDLAALGLDPAASSGSMPAASDEDSGATGNGGDKNEKGKKKKKRR